MVQSQGGQVVRNSTETLIVAMRILSQDIQSEDGVVSAATAEAAQRLAEQQERIKRLEDIINRASLAFFSDSSHRKVSIAMHKILEEFTREAKP